MDDFFREHRDSLNEYVEEKFKKKNQLQSLNQKVHQ